MKDTHQSLRIAVVQAAPVLMDKSRTIAKIVDLISKAANQNAQLIVFPESFIPAYPRGFSYGFVVGSRTMDGRQDWKRYYDNSVIVPSSDTEQIASAARAANAYVSIGITERDAMTCTLYCTNLIFGPDGNLLSRHRKLKPTGSERLIWGEGDGSTLDVVDSPFGTIGALICWENYMPLARTALYAKGVSIYLAPTADAREQWQATMKHIALEGRCFVIGCNQYVTKDDYPQDLLTYNELADLPHIMSSGGSCIVDPFGNYVVEPVRDCEELIIADLDLEQVVLSRLDFDPCGHYSRPDVFKFKVIE